MLRIPRAHLVQMLDHAAACAPEEACGLLGGVGEQARRVIAVTNSLHSPVRFRMAPHEQLAAFVRFEEEGLDLIGIYHSHPNGPPTPSPTDLAEFAYPGTAYLILAPGEAGWQARAFRLEDGRIEEIGIHEMPVG